jgi:hypothetical protein
MPAGRPRKFTNEHIEWIREKDASGTPRRRIELMFFQKFGFPVSYESIKVFSANNPRGRNRKPAPKREQLEVTLNYGQVQEIRDVAFELGYEANHGIIAGEGDVAAMLQAILAGELKLVPVGQLTGNGRDATPEL